MAKDKENKKVGSREKILARARERFPDRKFTDIGAEPEEGAADLDDAIDELLEELTSRQKATDEKNSRLAQLLGSDPETAELIQYWIEHGDPRGFVVERYGDDLGMSAEAKERYQNEFNAWNERKAANDALAAEAEKNWQASLQALEDWGNGKGLSMEQKRDIMVRLLAIAFNGQENKYDVEDFELVFKAGDYDNAVTSARHEGEVTGRNAKMNAVRKERALTSSLPPAAVGGQGGTTVEKRPEGPKSPWSGIR